MLTAMVAPAVVMAIQSITYAPVVSGRVRCSTPVAELDFRDRSLDRPHVNRGLVRF
jgi:hypothetical protein